MNGKKEQVGGRARDIREKITWLDPWTVQGLYT